MTAGKQEDLTWLIPIPACEREPAPSNAYGPLMTSSSVARFSKLQLVLEPEHGELVRAFVREAALAESVPVPVASLIADDAVEAWEALCLPDAGRQRVRVELLCSRGDVRTPHPVAGSFAIFACGGIARRQGPA